MIQFFFYFISWSLIFQRISSLNINFNQENNDIQLKEAIQTISNSNDESNCLYIFQNITIMSVHYIIKNITFV